MTYKALWDLPSKLTARLYCFDSNISQLNSICQLYWATGHTASNLFRLTHATLSFRLESLSDFFNSLCEWFLTSKLNMISNIKPSLISASKFWIYIITFFPIAFYGTYPHLEGIGKFTKIFISITAGFMKLIHLKFQEYFLSAEHFGGS